ncbi:MAG TPA: hypothetical protein VGN12_20615 [Pirellulales bacterium]|jgi:hypothetical protein
MALAGVTAHPFAMIASQSVRIRKVCFMDSGASTFRLRSEAVPRNLVLPPFRFFSTDSRREGADAKATALFCKQRDMERHMFWRKNLAIEAPPAEFWEAAKWINDCFYTQMKLSYRETEQETRHLHVFNAFLIYDRYILLAIRAGLIQPDDQEDVS